MLKQLISARFYTDKNYESIEDMCKHEKLRIPELNIYGQRWHCAPFVKRVIISPPATIILWQDDTKTVCKCSEGDEFDAEKGIAMCFLKKMLGNPSQVRKFIDKWMKENSVECSQHLIEGKKAYFYMIGENPVEIWGIPIEEARRVIEVYKYTHKMPSKDYQKGFEDAVKYMNEHIKSIMAEQFKSFTGERECEK